MASGVSTAIWGPPLWRILHTLSFASPQQLRDAAATVIQFLTNLAHILPCKWCRESYTLILDELPNLNTTIASGQLAKWMYQLHARVNNKLGVTTPKYTSIEKRFIVRPVQWSPSDVWDTISLFGLNFTPAKREMYRIFWDSWPTILRLGEGGDPRVPDLLAATPCPCVDGAFIATCLVLEAAHRHHPPPTPDAVHARVTRYATARASGGCRSGVCE